ncbi:MAG: type VI secretion system membrane subunit TssM [Vicinamibacterales bacterium]
MFAFLKRSIVVLVGFLLIAAFIWFAGPYFSFANIAPLESDVARLIAIGVVVGCWVLYRLYKRLRAFRAGDRLLTAVVAQPQPETARPPAEVVKLRERFDEAVTALKEQQRTSGQSIYDLPWYVIIGPPGSGKTTALLNSGLKFPLEQRVGKGALRGVGGTRNCDWWFTDEAVFLDTAGRYTTQDSDAESDSLGWNEFLALLRQHRARRPLNGVILTMNAHDLLLGGPSVREAHVEAARRRLDELNRELRIQLPVYVMITKCDLVDGFAEYFDDLKVEGRAQVWGVTFPYQQTVANEAPGVFPAEFDALMTRLNERVLERMAEARDQRRRTKIFGFPQQMATVRDTLTDWIRDVFSSRGFAGQILLRGVYFTSGTQEGTPIDRLLGSIGRRFGAGDAVVTPQGPGKAYFVERLLKEVMIGESGLAGVNRQLELRKASLQLGAYAATGLLATAGVLALSVSYRHNREFLDQAAIDIDAFSRTATVGPSAPLDAIVNRLDGIRGVVDEAGRYAATTSWPMRWGLYQGRVIGDAAHDAYIRELDSILLPRLASELRASVVQYSTDPQNLYLYFKAYLMLGQPQHLDPDYLQSMAEQEWRQGDAAAMGAGPALSQHLKALLAEGGTLRPIPLDPILVSQARSSIRQTSIPKILYDAIKRRYTTPADQGLRLDQRAGLGAEQVFTRRSGLPLSTPIPSLYTRDVFKHITGEGRAEFVKDLTNDAWVWGDSGGSTLANAGTLVSAATNLYEQDYIEAWNTLLKDLQFAPFSTIPQADAALRILTSPTSPLSGLVRVVADNTTLVDPNTATPGTSLLDRTKKRVSDTLTGVLKPIEGAVGAAQVEPGALVTVEFQWARQLTAGEAGKTQLDGILKTMSEIQQQLDTVGPDVAGASAVQILQSPSFRGLMQTLRDQSTALPEGLRTLVSQIAEAPNTAVVSDATEQIKSMYDQLVVPQCTEFITNKYPFAASAVDVPLSDFVAVFGYDGLFDKFFTDHLASQVDMSGSAWAWRAGAVNLSQGLLEQFQAARAIRDMFFAPGAKTPQIQFFVTFSDLDANATRAVITLDGQNMDSKNLKQPVLWPGSQPGRATTSFEGTYFDPAKVYAGPWDWFRLVDDTRMPAAGAQQWIMLNVQDRYHRVHVTVEPSTSSTSPSASPTWRQFSCAS